MKLRCPRCSLEIEGRDRFQVCKFCHFKGYFLLADAAPISFTVDDADAAALAAMSPAERERLRLARLKKAKQPTFTMVHHVPTAEDLAEEAAAARREKRQRRGDGWLRNALLRILADGKGRAGDGPSLWQLIPPTSVLAVVLAGTAFGLILASTTRGGLTELRGSDAKFTWLTALDLAGLFVGWIEWWRHRGERWGLFARILGGLAAILGGAYILIVLADVVRSIFA